MTERISFQLAPEAYEAKRALENYIARCGLGSSFCELIKLRVSMMNGCAFCVDMHWTALRKSGAEEAKLYGLSAWRELPCYDARERAALAWAEAVTFVASSRVDDELYEQTAKVFSAKEIADLTYVVVSINGWNRLCVAFRTLPASLTRPSP